MSKLQCTVPGCMRRQKYFGRKLCDAHYRRLLRNGNVGSWNIRPVGTDPGPIDKTPCPIRNCTRRALTKGLCYLHSEILRLSQTVDEDGNKCQVEGCNLIHAAKGFCVGHYNAFRVNSVGAEIRAQLSAHDFDIDDRSESC